MPNQKIPEMSTASAHLQMANKFVYHAYTFNKTDCFDSFCIVFLHIVFQVTPEIKIWRGVNGERSAHSTLHPLLIRLFPNFCFSHCSVLLDALGVNTSESLFTPSNTIMACQLESIFLTFLSYMGTDADFEWEKKILLRAPR